MPSSITLRSVLLLTFQYTGTAWGACSMIREYSSAKRCYSPLPVTGIILQCLQQKIWFSTTSYGYDSPLPVRSFWSIRLYILLSSQGKMLLPLLLLELVLLLLSAESKEPRALLRHFSPERRTSPLKEREIVWAKKEQQSSREFRRRFFDTLFLEDCSTEMSYMMFEHLSIFCSV